MINPHKLNAKHIKQNHPRFAGGKFYLAMLSGAGYAKTAQRIFKRASEANAYASRLRNRWVRLYDAAVFAMSRQQEPATE